MARTTHNWVTQGTLGIVPEAELPTDPVPLSQAGTSGNDVMWYSSAGNWPQVTVSVSKRFGWNAAEVRLSAFPYTVPFEQRLKEVYWHTFSRNHRLNVWRGNPPSTPMKIVATVGNNTHAYFDLLYQPLWRCYFEPDSTIRLSTSWTLLTRWEIVSRDVPEIEPVEVTSLTTGLGPTSGLQSTALNPENQDVPEIVERPGNRWISWIRRKWR